MSSNFCSDAFELNDVASISSSSSSQSATKENTILITLLDESCSNKAEALRLQQVKNYKEFSKHSVSQSKSKDEKNKVVRFSPKSLIHDGIKEGNKYEVLDCISTGLSVNFNENQGEGMSLLHHACVYDDYIIAHALVKQGACINLQDDFGCSPLHVCCMWDSIKCAQMLLANNAAVDLLDVDGNLAVDLATQNSNLKATMKLHMLQKQKIDENEMEQIKNKKQKQMIHDIQELLKKGKSIDVVSSANKVSLLHIAVSNGYLTAARLLLENSVNVNATDDLLWTPLHCAAKYHQRKMVKLLLSHFANPHALTCNFNLPRDLAQDQTIKEELLNAEETFLDLEQQKTPVKTKRFSASLLDETEEGDDPPTINIPTRNISTVKISKRDLLNERKVLVSKKDELKKELNRRSFTLQSPHYSNSNSPLRLNSLKFTFEDFSSPRREEVIIPDMASLMAGVSPITSASSTMKRTQKHSKIHHSKTGSLVSNQGSVDLTEIRSSANDEFLIAVITIQKAFRKYLLKLALCEENTHLLERQAYRYYDELVMQNAEDIALSSDQQRSQATINRNSWGSPHCVNQTSILKVVKPNRPLSTGAVPNMTRSPRSHSMRHHGNHLRHNANGNNGLYRRGDSVCSTDSGVSMMTMEGMHHVGPEYYAMMNHGNQYRNLEVVGTVKRCLSNKEVNHANMTSMRFNQSASRRHRTQNDNRAARFSAIYNEGHQKAAPPVFIPPLTKTVAKIMSTATQGLNDDKKVQKQPASKKKDQHKRNQQSAGPFLSHYPTMPRNHTSRHNEMMNSSATLRHNQSMMTSPMTYQQVPPNIVDLHRAHSSVSTTRNHRYGTMLSDRSSLLREEQLLKAMSEQLNISSTIKLQNNQKHSYKNNSAQQMNQSPISMTSHNSFPTCPSPHHSATSHSASMESVKQTDQNSSSSCHGNSKQKRARSLSRRTGNAAPTPPPRHPTTRITSTSSPPKNPPFKSHTIGRPSTSGDLQGFHDDDILPPPPDHFLSDEGEVFPPPPTEMT